MGKNTGGNHAARDLDAFAARNFKLLEPYRVDVACKNIEGDLASAKLPVILPHEYIYHLYHTKPKLYTEQLLKGCDGETDALKQFWRHTEHVQPWMRHHPSWAFIRREPELCLPLRLHGDAISYNKQNSKLMVYNFCSVIAHDLPADRAKIMMLGVREKGVLSLDPLLLALKWSFQCLADGIMPTHDENGDELTGERAKYAGQPIAGGRRHLLVQFVGDWEFLKSAFGLDDTHYNTDRICFLCGATKSHGPACAWDYSCTPGWSHFMTDPDAWLADRVGNVLCSVTGFHLWAIRIDLMHVICLGVFHWLNGSIIWELMLEGRWGPEHTPWKDARGVQLERATKEFRQWCKDHNVCHSHPKFTLASLSMHSLSSRPCMKGKAHNMNVVADWLASVTASQTGRGDQHHDLRANACWGFTHGLRVMKRAGMYLTQRQCMQLEECRQHSLQCYGALSSACAANGIPHYVTKPKWHMWDHALRIACREKINPVYSWCYRDESFLKSIARIARRVHGGGFLETKVMHLWLMGKAVDED